MFSLPVNIFEGPASRVIVLVALMIALLFFLVVTTSIVLLIRQYLHRVRKSRNARREQQYQNLLIDCMFYPDNATKKNCITKDRKGKKHLFESIIYLMHNFTGAYAEKLKGLFYEAGLEKYLLKKLRSSRWWIRAQGLRESRLMKFASAIAYAEKDINNKHLELRAEAQITIIALKTQDPFDFFKRLKKPFSRWDMIHLFEELNQWEHKPDASQWLKTSNPGVLLFALRIMALWGIKGSSELTWPLHQHPHPAVRAEIAWYSAHSLDSPLWLKVAQKYKTEHQKVRQKLAQTSGMIPDVPIKELIEWFNHETNTSVKIDLARAMLTHGQNNKLNANELDALATVA